MKYMDIHVDTPGAPLPKILVGFRIQHKEIPKYLKPEFQDLTLFTDVRWATYPTEDENDRSENIPPSISPSAFFWADLLRYIHFA